MKLTGQTRILDMSPPHNGHRFNSSPSSTGTRPKSSSRNSQNLRNSSGTGGGGGGGQPQPPKSELERLLREQQAKLRTLEQEQNSVHGGAGVLPNPEFQNYHEKLRLLQALNGAPSNPQQENFYEVNFFFLKNREITTVFLLTSIKREKICVSE